MTLRYAGLTSIAYFYFDFRDIDNQNRRNLLLSLLSQLSAGSDHCCDVLHRVYVTQDKRAHQPADDELTQSLKEALTSSNDCTIYVIIDAFDECLNTFGMPSPRELVLGLVTDSELVSLPLPNLHIAFDVSSGITSRRNRAKTRTSSSTLSLSYTDTRMGKRRKEDQNLVIETLSERADGMHVFNSNRHNPVLDIFAGSAVFSAS